MKKRFKVILVLVGLAVLVALFYAEEDWRGWSAWHKFKREWEAKGETFDYVGVVPPLVPDDQNFAMSPIVVTSYGNMLTHDGKMIPYEQRDAHFVNRLQITLDFKSGGPTNAIGNWQKGNLSDLGAWQKYYRVLAATTNVFPVSPQPQTPAQDVLMAMSKYDAVLNELRQATILPYSRFPLNYSEDNPATILLPHLAALKQCVPVLQLRAIAELQNNQSEKALDDIKLTLRLTDSIRTEPLLISHLVRIAMLNLALQPIYEGLVKQKWTDAQLVMLDAELSKLDFIADYKLAMRGEMAFQNGIVHYLRHHPGQYLGLLGDASNYGNMSPAEFTVATAMHWHLVPSGWFFQNQLHCARAMEEFYLPAADDKKHAFMPSQVIQADATVERERKNLTPYNIAECFMLPALGKAAQKFARAESSVDLARVAIALERYRLAHGEYSGSLDGLSPDFIKSIPHDIIGGQPLHYRRTDDGQFVLYSVGWNEKDDGGVVIFNKLSSPGIDPIEGDWVWHQTDHVAASPNMTDSGVLSADDKATLLKQAEIVQAAVNEWDFDTLMKHTPPAVIQLFGKDAFEQAGRAGMAQLKEKGVKFIKTDFGEPTKTYQTGKEIVCFVPRTSVLQVRETQIKSKAYWVAIRANGDSEWKFFDGAGIQTNKDLLWKMFPELPRNVQFPEWKQEVVN